MDAEKLREIQFRQFEEFHLNQANHNYIFCYSVFESSKKDVTGEKQFFDWVITSAFYSSLHYVRCALSIDKEFMFYKIHFESKTLEEARRHRITNPQAYPSDAAAGRHEILKRIVKDTYPSVSIAYNMLLDNSMTSRYCQFKNATCTECESSLDLLDAVRDWFTTKFSVKLPTYLN
jgi:hypothetical protein